MLEGRFGDTTGAPYLEGLLVIPRVSLRGNISFLVDTGADMTVLMPVDAVRMGVDHGQLTTTIESAGIGGTSLDFTEDALLAFANPGQALHVFAISLIIAAPEAHKGNYPSLLGRDILNQMRMICDPSRGVLTFDRIESDLQVPISTVE